LAYKYHNNEVPEICLSCQRLSAGFFNNPFSYDTLEVAYCSAMLFLPTVKKTCKRYKPMRREVKMKPDKKEER